MARPAIPKRALDRFIDALAGGCTVREAAEAASIGYRTAYDYRRDDHDFAERWDEAREAGVDILVKEARARALDRNDPKSADLLRFLLRGERREVYGDRVDVTAKVEAVTSAELAAARAAAMERPELMAEAARLLGAGREAA